MRRKKLNVLESEFRKTRNKKRRKESSYRKTVDRIENEKRKVYNPIVIL